MRKNFRNFSLLTALLILQEGNCLSIDATQPGNAPGTNELSIEILVEEALTKNPELNFYLSEIEAARAGVKQAGLWRNPELNGSVGYKNARDKERLSAEGVAWSVSVVQPIEWPGRIGLRKAIANRDLELAELGLQKFKAALAGRIRNLAFGLFASNEKASAALEVAKRFRELREVLIQRDPAGTTPLLETRVIEATELIMQKKASEAELAAQAVLLELNQLRGAPILTSLRVRQPAIAFRPAEKAESLIQASRTNNFDYRIRASELAQQGIKVALAKNERFPTISVGPSFSEENAFERERIAGVGISLPLPLWNRNSSNIDTAAARKRQAETMLLVTEREIARKILESLNVYESKLREMEKWRPDAIEHFREAAEIADRHYRLGAVPVSVYVEMQKQYLEAVTSLLDTRKEALEAAQTLELIAGPFGPLVHISDKGD